MPSKCLLGKQIRSHETLNLSSGGSPLKSGSDGLLSKNALSNIDFLFLDGADALNTALNLVEYEDERTTAWWGMQ